VEKHVWLYYSTARRFCYEMALGVAYLHGRQPRMLIHRDIKPSNYMLTGSLRVKLGDFGVARIVSNDTMDSSRHGDATLDQTSNCGTVRFMAPEVHAAPGADKTRLYSPKADIFSLGLVFYFVFEHKLPSLHGAASPADHVRKLLEGHRPEFLDTPKAVQAIINRCWATEPTARPSAGELIELLARLPEARGFPCCGLRRRSRYPGVPQIWELCQSHFY
jgi:serine/threonine protein kinase